MATRVWGWIALLAATIYDTHYDTQIMAYLVLAYPTFAATELAWIEAIRTHHDPQATLVAPHVTLVFPLAEDAMTLEQLVAHLYEVAAKMPAPALALRCALVMPETGRAGGHLFLVPDEGMSQLVKLHDALYRGPLAPHLRLDIPFVPHITVGAGHDLAALHQVAQELNATEFALHAKIEQLTLVRHAAGAVATMAEAALAGSQIGSVRHLAK
jgi:2'-5' RNA ligase